MRPLLPRIETNSLPKRGLRSVDATTLNEAMAIVEDVRANGVQAIVQHSLRFGDIDGDEQLVIDSDQLNQALDDVGDDTVALLRRVAARISSFAAKQRECLLDLESDIDGGSAGHTWLPIASVGAYAPAGRHPLPSSVMMTTIPARVAGVESVVVASPKPTPVTLAAAAVAGADSLIAVGGPQAIAAMAFGTLGPASDLIVGPGNRWVTAAKKYLFGEVGIDGLAGPSEILVIADESADPGLVAADLIAQAEHDIDAIPILVSLDGDITGEVETELKRQLQNLPTRATAIEALANGVAVVVESLGEAVEISDRLAPEHLALHVSDPTTVMKSLRSYGSVFVGHRSAEAFADYGAGPNHVLPTAGGARFQSGLSVATFLRSPTWLDLTSPSSLIDDTKTLARLEGLEGHARAAMARAGSDS